MKLFYSILFLFYCSFLQAQYGAQDSTTIPVSGGQSATCLVHLPPTYSTDPAGTKYPLVIMFQGAGEYGYQASAATKNGIGYAIYHQSLSDSATLGWNGDAVNPKTGLTEHFIAISTLTPTNSSNQSLSFSQCDYLLNYVINTKYAGRIDTTCMYFTGLSAGGAPPIYYACHISNSNCCPAVFSFSNISHRLTGIVPMSAENNGQEPVKYLVADSVKVWAFAGNHDEQGHGITTIAFNDSVAKYAPSLVKPITVYDGGHSGWSPFYAGNYRDTGNGLSVYQWMLANRRGSVAPPPTNTITTGTISPTTFCVTASAGSAATIPFTSTGTFSNNTYTAQLSNSSSSFSSPVTIGTLTSNTNSGSINGLIPANATTGTGYRIRVISNNPAVTGSTNTTNLIINLAANSIAPTANQSFPVTGVGNTLTVTDKSTATAHQWYANGNPIQNATLTTWSPNFATVGTYTVTCRSTFSCGVVVSNAVSITVTSVSSSRIYITGSQGGANLIGPSCGGSFTWNPGDTLVFPSNTRWNRIFLKCIHDVTIINEGATPTIIGDYYNGQPNVQSPGGFYFQDCYNIHLTGTGTAGLNYGFMDSSVQGRGLGFQIYGKSHDIEVDHLQIMGRNAGAWVKEEQLDNNCDPTLAFPLLVIHDINIHDNYIHNILNEGLYLGSTAPNSNDTGANNQHPVVVCSNGDTNRTLTARLGNIHVYFNIFDSTGRAAVQLSSADSGFNEINNNTISRSGYSGTYGQGNGISIGGYTHVYCHDNAIHSTTAAGLSSFGAGWVRFINNIVDSSGIKRDGTVIAGANSILLDTRNTSNPSPGQPNPLLTTFDIENNSVTNATSITNTQIYNTYTTYTDTGNKICNSGTFNVPAGITYSTVCNGTPATVTTSPISGSPFCETATTGANISVNFTVSGVINGGNTFTAYLSDANGSFASKTNIGSVNGTASGTISGSLPANLPTGAGYKVRVDANSPVTTGTTQGISVNLAANSIAPTATQNIFINANGNTLTVNETYAANSRQWYSNGVAISGATATTYIPNFATAGTYSITCRSTFSCGIITSNAVSVVVTNPPTPTITTGTITGSPFCVTTTAGAAVQVKFTSTGTFNSGNIYTAQLSDSSGSFASPISIGTLSSTANSGTINSTIPAGSFTSGHYRIRVVSSNPIIIGSQNTIALRINLASTSIAPTTTQNILTSTNGTLLRVTNTTAATSLQWMANGVAISGKTTATYTPNFATAGTYQITCQSVFACATLISNSVTVNVTAPIQPAINTNAINGSPFCVTGSAGAAVSVSFSSVGTYTSGNVYTAQLSNSSGSFTSPVNIGSLTSTLNSGTINATIPAGTLTSGTYRIRVVSSKPSVVGSDNGTNLSINLAANNITPATTQNIYTDSVGSILNVSNQSVPASVQWYANGIAISGATSLTYTPLFFTAGTYAVTCKSTFACSTITSNSVTIIVTDAPPPPPQTITTGSISGSPFCVSGSITAAVTIPFTSTGTFTSNTYTAQLSDANGSFGSAINIGTLTSNANSGSISGTIPINTITGSAYRVRVISNSPVVIGTDNGTNLSINFASNSIAPTGTQNILTGSSGTTLTVSETSNVISRQWYSNGSAISGATGSTYTPNFGTSGTYNITCQSTFACSTITSNTITINVTDPIIPTITVGEISGFPACVKTNDSAAVSVQFTSVGVYNSNNIYTVQLSDANGSFNSFINIGSIASNLNSGTINAEIPANTPTGSNYLVRIVSSSPVLTSAPNSNNLSINLASNNVTPAQTQNLLTGQTGNTLTVTETSSATHQWFVNGSASGNSTASYIPSFATAGTYQITCQSTFACGVITSNTVTIIVTLPPTPTVVTGRVLGSPYCVTPNIGSAISVPYTVTGTYQSGNTFTAQLSNANGSFVNFTNIGSITSQASGTISANIPQNTLTGSSYRIRVISSNPTIIGSDNGFDLAVNLASNQIAPSGTQTLVTNAMGNILTATEASTPISRQWYDGLTPITGQTGLTYTPDFSSAGTHLVTLNSVFSCATITSNFVTVIVNNPPPDTICVTTKTPPHDTAFHQTFSKIVKVIRYKDTSICQYFNFFNIFRFAYNCHTVHNSSYYIDSTVMYDSVIHQIIVHDTTTCTITGYLYNSNDLDMAYFIKMHDRMGIVSEIQSGHCNWLWNDVDLFEAWKENSIRLMEVECEMNKNKPLPEPPKEENTV